jgi:hypothetical protein
MSELKMNHEWTLTHSQLVEGFKRESQTKDNERIRNWGTFPNSQHYKGVEGRVGAPRWH